MGRREGGQRNHSQIQFRDKYKVRQSKQEEKPERLTGLDGTGGFRLRTLFCNPLAAK